MVGGEGDKRGGWRSSPLRGILTGADPVNSPTPIVIDSHNEGCSASYSRLLSLNCSSFSSIACPTTHSAALVELVNLDLAEKHYIT